MPYTTPNTVTGSDVLTAALWNTQVKDNLEWLRKPQNAMVYLTGTQPALSTGGTISWNAAAWDTSTSPVTWSLTDASKLYVREAGIYMLTCIARATMTASHGSPSVYPTISVRRTLVGVDFITQIMQPDNAGYTTFRTSFSTVAQLTAGESVSVNIVFTQGGTATMGASNGIAGTNQLWSTTRFTLTQVGVY